MDADLTASLNTCAAGSRWYDGAGALAVCDALALPGLSRPARLLFARAADDLYFVPLAQDVDGAWQDVAATIFYQREVLGWLQRHGSAVTAAGGYVTFDSALEFSGCDLLRADAGGSSNTVSQLGCGDVTVMHKLYRKLTPEERECEATARIGKINPHLVPRCLGSYRYSAPDGATRALGLLTECVPGHGLHQDLSANVRALWPMAAGEAHAHIDLLLPGLHGWRKHIEQLHTAMAQALDSATAFDMPDLCTKARERIIRIRPQLAVDPLLAADQRRHFLRMLDALELQVLTPVALRAAPCHGDLHLSHLLWNGVDGRRIIDLSPPPVGHPLQDWVALERALEYFCLDEAALELAPHAGMTQADLMQTLVTGLPANPAIAARVALLTRWQRAVRGALCGEHPAGAAHRATYCARLLQELDYNYSHRRPYYRCIDFYFLDQHFSSLIGE